MCGGVSVIHLCGATSHVLLCHWCVFFVLIWLIFNWAVFSLLCFKRTFCILDSILCPMCHTYACVASCDCLILPLNFWEVKSLEFILCFICFLLFLRDPFLKFEVIWLFNYVNCVWFQGERCEAGCTQKGAASVQCLLCSHPPSVGGVSAHTCTRAHTLTLPLLVLQSLVFLFPRQYVSWRDFSVEMQVFLISFSFFFCFLFLFFLFLSFCSSPLPRAPLRSAGSLTVFPPLWLWSVILPGCRVWYVLWCAALL